MDLPQKATINRSTTESDPLLFGQYCGCPREERPPFCNRYVSRVLSIYGRQQG